jgi:hypothetical protein
VTAGLLPMRALSLRVCRFSLSGRRSQSSS